MKWPYIFRMINKQRKVVYCVLHQITILNQIIMVEAPQCETPLGSIAVNRDSLRPRWDRQSYIALEWTEFYA